MPRGFGCWIVGVFISEDLLEIHQARVSNQRGNSLVACPTFCHHRECEPPPPPVSLPGNCCLHQASAGDLVRRACWIYTAPVCLTNTQTQGLQYRVFDSPQGLVYHSLVIASALLSIVSWILWILSCFLPCLPLWGVSFSSPASTGSVFDIQFVGKMSQSGNWIRLTHSHHSPVESVEHCLRLSTCTCIGWWPWWLVLVAIL